MIKRYSQKWQRYFVKMLVGVPFFYDDEEVSTPELRGMQKMAIASFAAMAGVMCFDYKI